MTSENKRLTDEELFREMRKGSQQAFRELYERHEPPLHRYVLHMCGDRGAAEEITHEVFLQMTGPNVRFDERRGSLEAYLYGVARNLVRAFRRATRFEEQQDHSAPHDILGDLIKDEMTAALYTAIQELPVRYRDAVVLCDIEERSYDDAARLMSCPIGTVRSRLHRARLLLANKLRPLAAVPEAAL